MAQWGFQQGANPDASDVAPELVSEEWVEKAIVPRLQSLSRRGVIVAYESGIEPQSKAQRDDGESGFAVADPDPRIFLGATATDVVSFDVPRGTSIGGEIRFHLRAATGPHLQSLIGSLLFAVAVQTGGNVFSTPGTGPMLPDTEVIAASSGTLSSLWSFFMTGSDLSGHARSTLRIRPSTSLSVATLSMSYHYRLF